MRWAWRPLLREVASYIVVGIFVALLTVLVWWTRHPDAESLSAVRRWPIVGSLVGRLQDRYLPAPPGDGPIGSSSSTHGTTGGGAAEADAGAVPGAGEGDPNRVVVFDVIYVLKEPRPYIWVSEGTALRREPRFGAEVVGEMEAMTNLFVEERRGDWLRVRHGGLDAWVVRPPAGSSEDLASRPAPVLPLPPEPLDPAVIDRALGSMSDDRRAFRLGAYAGWSDVDVGEVIETCEGPLARLEGLYRRELGVEPVGETAETLLIFASRSAYDAFSGGPISALGHAGPGYAATYGEGRSTPEICSTLAHEAAHLMNRRSIGPSLPPWLGEGIAEYAQWQVSSGHAPKFSDWEAAGGDLPELRELAGLDEAAFRDPRDGAVRYAASGYWIAYLLAEPELAAGFRRFLRYLASGGPWGESAVAAVPEPVRLSPDLGDDLVHFLGRDPARLNAGIRTWLWSRS